MTAPLVIDADGPSGNEILGMVGWRREVRGVTKHVYDAAGCDLGNMSASDLAALARWRERLAAAGWDVKNEPALIASSVNQWWQVSFWNHSGALHRITICTTSEPLAVAEVSP